MAWVIATDENHFWDRESHSWVVGEHNATQYSDEEREYNRYPKLISEWGAIEWKLLPIE